MKKILLGVILILSIWFVSCKKSDVDFNKYNDITLNPEILTPLAQAKLVAGDLLKQDSIIKYDPDGLIKLEYLQDSLFKLSADSILVDIKLSSPPQKFNVGNIVVDGLNQNRQFTLDFLTQDADPNLKQAFQTLNGTTDTFPEVYSPISQKIDLDVIDKYESVKVTSGTILFEITNSLPTKIDSIEVEVFDNLPNLKSLGSFYIKDIGTNQTKSDSILLLNQKLSNTLSYQIRFIHLAKSTSEVPINLQDQIIMNCRFQRLKCNGGRAKIPAQVLKFKDIGFDVSSNGDERIKNLEFNNANFEINAISSINTSILVDIDLLSATINGNTLAPLQFTAPTGNTTANIDLTNAKLDLSTDPIKDYNIIKADVTISLNSSNQIVDFDSSDNVSIEFYPTNIDLKYVDGYLGQRKYNLAAKDLDFNQLSSLGKGITLENPILQLMVRNSFGIPTLVEFDIKAYNKLGDLVNMNAPNMNFPYPTIAEKGTTKSQTFNIDKTNSNIVEAIGLPAERFEVTATATMNPNGFVGQYDNHVLKSNELILGFGGVIPLTFTSNNFSYTDTVEIGEILLDSTFQLLELSIKTINGFPLGGTIDLMFMDENYVVVDSLKDVTLLQSGICDANGRVTQKSTYLSEVLMNEDLLTNLRNGKAVQLGIRTKFDTYNSGTQPVSIYTDTRLDVILGFRAKAKFKVNTP